MDPVTDPHGLSECSFLWADTPAPASRPIVEQENKLLADTPAPVGQIVPSKKKQMAKKKAVHFETEMAPQEKDRILKDASQILNKFFKKWGVEFKDLGFLSINDVVSLGYASLFVFLNKCELLSKGDKAEFRQAVHNILSSDPNRFASEDGMERARAEVLVIISMVNLSDGDKDLVQEVLKKLAGLFNKLSTTKYYHEPMYELQSKVHADRQQKVCLYIYSLFHDLTTILPEQVIQKVKEIKLHVSDTTVVPIWRLDQLLPPESLLKLTEYIKRLCGVMEKDTDVAAKKLSHLVKERSDDPLKQFHYFETVLEQGQQWQAVTYAHTCKLLDALDNYHGLFEISLKQAELEGYIKGRLWKGLSKHLFDLVLADFKGGRSEGRDFEAWTDVKVFNEGKKFAEALLKYLERKRNGWDVDTNIHFNEELTHLRKLFHPSLHGRVNTLLEDCYSIIMKEVPAYCKAMDYQYRSLIGAEICTAIPPQEASNTLLREIIFQFKAWCAKLDPKLDENDTVLIVDNKRNAYRHPLLSWSIRFYECGEVNSTSENLNERHRQLVLQSKEVIRRRCFRDLRPKAAQLTLQDIDKRVVGVKACTKSLWDLRTMNEFIVSLVSILEHNFNKQFLEEWRVQLECDDYDTLDQWVSDEIPDAEFAKSPTQRQADAKEEEEEKVLALKTLSAPTMQRKTSIIGLSASHQGALPHTTQVLLVLRNQLLERYGIASDHAPCDLRLRTKQTLYEMARYDQVYNLHNLICTLEMIQSGKGSSNLKLGLIKLARLQAHLVVERGGTWRIRSEEPDAIIRHSLQAQLEMMGLSVDGIVVRHLDAETILFRYGGSGEELDYQEFSMPLLNDFLRVNSAICGVRQNAISGASSEEMATNFKKSWDGISVRFSREQFLKLVELQEGLTKTIGGLEQSIREERLPGRKRVLTKICNQLETVGQVIEAIMIFGQQRGLSSIAQWAFLTLQFAIKNTACVHAFDTGVRGNPNGNPIETVMRAIGRKDFNRIEAFSQRFQFDAPLSAQEKRVLPKLDVVKGFEYICGYCTVHDTKESRSPYIELASTFYRWSLATLDWKSSWAPGREKGDPDQAVDKMREQLIDDIIESGNVVIKLVETHL